MKWAITILTWLSLLLIVSAEPLRFVSSWPTAMQYFPMNETSGVVRTALGGNYVAYNTAPAAVVPSPMGNATYTSSAVYGIANADFGNASKSWSLSCWLRPNTQAAAGFVLIRGNWSVPDVNYALIQQTDMSVGAGLSIAGGWKGGYSSANSLTLNQWAWVVVTWTNGYCNVWVNGIQHGPMGVTSGTAANNSISRFAAWSSTGNGIFYGAVSHIAIYGSTVSAAAALTDRQVKAKFFSRRPFQ